MKRNIIFATALIALYSTASLGGDQVTLGYRIEASGVYFYDKWSNRYLPVPEADVATFKQLNEWHGQDKKALYFRDEAVKGVNKDAFRIITPTLGVDDRAIFYQGGQFKVCDAKTFRHVSDRWYVDDKCAYNASLSPRTLPDADPTTFQAISSSYARDKFRVYAKWVVLDGADPATFSADCEGCPVCGRDKNSCYLDDHEIPCDCGPTKVAATSRDPYDGSGGVFLGSPSQKEIESRRFDFRPERFAAFKVGTTTRDQVVQILGKPAGWMTRPDGTSQFEYDFVMSKNEFGMRKVVATWFDFDKEKTLIRLKYPEGSDKGSE